MTDPWHGKVAIITGGASGIGRALAFELATRGSELVLVDNDAARLLETETQLKEKNASVQAANVDVRDRDGLCRLAQEVVGKHHRVDYLFNNAGISVFGEARDFDWSAWWTVIDTNFMGVVNGVFAFYALMVQQQHGHIINTASLSGLVPTPGAVSYTASKCAVLGLSHALRCEAAPLGVRVSVVCPAAVWTSIVETSRYVNLNKDTFIKSVPGNRISAEACAKEILKGVAANKATIAPSAAKYVWWLHRHFPVLTNVLMGKFAELVAVNRKQFFLDGSKASPKALTEKSST